MLLSFHRAGRLAACVLAGLTMLAAHALAGEAEIDITGVTLGGDADRARIEADIAVPADFTVRVIPDPYRAVIDIPGGVFRQMKSSGTNATALLDGYRFGMISKGKARIVADARGPLLVDAAYLEPKGAGRPARIVVELVPATEEQYRDSVARGSAVRSASAESITQLIDETDASAAPQETPPLASEPDRQLVIVIDPGHGGVDPGAIGLSKTREKDVVLDFGRALRDEVSKLGRFQVVLTRDDDRFLTLKDRVAVARRHKADLFIAIHADIVRGHSVRGATFYTLSEKASDAEAEALAQKENRADIIGGVDLGEESPAVADILIDLVQRESKSHALYFARRAYGEMKAITPFTGKPLRSAGFVVLKAPDVPSVLLELGYLSTAADEAMLTSPKWRSRTAKALAGAIDQYFAKRIADRSN